MPRIETHLNETEIKIALAHWVDAGCPVKGGELGRVRLHVSKTNGSDPREQDDWSAVVTDRRPMAQPKD